MTGFLESVKRAAIEAVHAEKPVSVLHGTVESTEPLNIRIDQKLVLRRDQLILTGAVKRRTEKVIYADGTTAELTFEAALEKGQAVILIRSDGGQKYIVLDRAEAIT